MIAITYHLTLEQPALITGLEGDPNTKTSLSYIPGSVLRGTLIGRHLDRVGKAELDSTGLAERQRFLSPATRYLNAYPQLNGKRALPTPASLVKAKLSEYTEHLIVAGSTPDENPKSGGTTIYDFAVAGDEEVQQPKGINKPYCCVDGAYVSFTKPLRRISIHTARDPIRGRATAEKGAVFQYNALAAGTTFAGAILCEHATDADAIAELLDTPELRIGGARTAGYGQVQLTDVQRHEAAMWREVDVNVAATEGELRITCLSPCIVRDGQGNISVDLGDALSREFQLGLEVIPQKTHRQVCTIGGFNRKWGLPLCQTQAIDAGSVFVFKWPAVGDEAALAATLQGLLAAGIGERRNDGFGRIAVNWQTRRRLTVAKYKPTRQRDVATQPTVTNIAIVQRMAERILRQKLDRNLAECVTSLRIQGGGQEHGISNSQLSRLRTEVRATLAYLQAQTNEPTANTAPSLSGLQAFVKGYKQTARRQLERVAHYHEATTTALILG